MSDRRWTGRASRWLLVGFLLVPAQLVGQERPLRADLELRLEEAVRTHAELESRWAPIDQALNLVGLDDVSRIDSVRVGPLMLLAPVSSLPAAQAALEAALVQVDGVLVGEGLPGAFDGARVYGFKDGSDRITSSGRLRAFQLFGEWSPPAPSPATGVLKEIVNTALPASVRGWAGDRGLDHSLTDGHGRADVIRLRSPLGVPCVIERDVDACVALFDVDFGNTPAQREAFIRAVYAESDWASLVRDRRLMAGRVQSEMCHGPPADPESCLSILSNSHLRGNVQAMPQSIRARLLQTAVNMGGGAAAWDRILALPEDASPREALEIAAGQPVKAVVAEWLDGFLSATPRAGGPTEGTSLRLAGIWIVLLAGFSLLSTRWRL